MSTTKKKGIRKFFNTMLLFPIAFTFIGIALPTFIEQVAGLEYFVKIKSIEVTDINCKDWTQEIAIDRTVRTSLLGYPQQELKLYKSELEIEPVFKTEELNKAIPYEHSEESLVLYTRDWRDKMPEEIIESLDTNATYFWVWDIDFEVSKYRELLNGKYRTNDFRIICEE